MSTRRKDKIALLIVALVVMFAPGVAYAAGINSILDAVSQGPDVFIAYMSITPLCSLINDFISPMMECMFEWGLNWQSIPYLNSIILWLQALSVTAVVIVRLWVGLKSGILQDGGSREYTLTEYFMKSVLALLAVSLMPTACRLVILFGKDMFDYIKVQTGGPDEILKWFDVSGINASALSQLSVINYLWLLLGVLAMLVLCLAVGYQFLRRQVEMLVISLIAPIVSIYSATEESSSQAVDLLKNLFGLVSQQWLQYVLVMIAITFGQQFLLESTGLVSSMGDQYKIFSGGGAVVKYFGFSIATFMAAIKLPSLIDRYTFSSSGTRLGGLAASQAMMALRAIIRRV